MTKKKKEEKEVREPLKAPEGFVLPSVCQCLQRIANRWDYYIKDDALYLKMWKEFSQTLQSIPKLNYFTSSDDPILMNIGKQIEDKFAPSIFAHATMLSAENNSSSSLFNKKI